MKTDNEDGHRKIPAQMTSKIKLPHSMAYLKFGRINYELPPSEKAVMIT